VVLTELRTKIQLEDKDDVPAHVAVPLRGRFKARSNNIVNIFVHTAAKTASGLTPGLWIRRLVDVLEAVGITRGWLFQDDNGRRRRMSSFAPDFFGRLFLIRDRDPSLFEPEVDIMEDYGLARSLRRGATTRATNAKVSETDINWICRWNTGGAEVAKGPMHVVYAEQKQMLPTFLRFSQAL
jgi:hypothetical protein